MDELFIHALETGSADHLTNDEKSEHFQALLTEYKRLQWWSSRCLGTEVSNFGGKPAED